MREAKEVVNEAKTALDGLRTLGAITGKALIKLTTSEGRWGGRPVADRDAERAYLVASLRSLGLSEEELADVDAGDRPWVIIDYVHGIFDGWGRGRQATEEQQDAYKQWERTWNTGLERQTPEECGRMMDVLQINNPERRELLEDYRHYVKTGKHRRPDVWAKRDTWQGNLDGGNY
jgi:hypothetical protein